VGGAGGGGGVVGGGGGGGGGGTGVMGGGFQGARGDKNQEPKRLGNAGPNRVSQKYLGDCEKKENYTPPIWSQEESLN